MNNLIVSQNQTLTMSSREIAELTSKQHSHVKRDIEKMCSDINHPNLEGWDYEHKGNVYTEYKLNKELTLCLISGYSAKIRMSIIKRWQELESKQTPQLPQSFAEALQLAADQAKQLELAAPKVEFVDRFVERESLQNATQVASSLNMKSARALNKALDEIGGVYNGSVKRSRIFTAKFISDGYGDVKQNEAGYPQSLFTTKGVTRIHELLVSEGYI